mmetsp:Transcript_18460/g.58288  ORF Transcript_18460/g.58288 Transcript_18460/m.58288 type:complete len:353 (+) Transcript_18460:3538-4596(+)
MGYGAAACGTLLHPGTCSASHARRQPRTRSLAQRLAPHRPSRPAAGLEELRMRWQWAQGAGSAQPQTTCARPAETGGLARCPRPPQPAWSGQRAGWPRPLAHPASTAPQPVTRRRQSQSRACLVSLSTARVRGTLRSRPSSLPRALRGPGRTPSRPRPRACGREMALPGRAWSWCGRSPPQHPPLSSPEPLRRSSARGASGWATERSRACPARRSGQPSPRARCACACARPWTLRAQPRRRPPACPRDLDASAPCVPSPWHLPRPRHPRRPRPLPAARARRCARSPRGWMCQAAPRLARGARSRWRCCCCFWSLPCVWLLPHGAARTCACAWLSVGCHARACAAPCWSAPAP